MMTLLKNKNMLVMEKVSTKLNGDVDTVTLTKENTSMINLLGVL
jgi:hypothetical protein